MAELKKKERRSISHEKVENGYIIIVSKQSESSKGEIKFDEKKHIASTATETKKLINKLTQL